MHIDPTIQNIVAAKVLAAQENREPSSRLSAGKLGWPLQWQMLHHYGVQAATPDEYTLRKFQRGKDVEDRIVEWVSPVKKQVPVEYRGVVGVADMVLDCPVEIKSVTNLAFKHIQKEGPKRGHILQGELYAKGLGVGRFWLAYVASDDYRVLTFELPVSGLVDEVIDRHEAQVRDGRVPVFRPEEEWHTMKKYSPYPSWMKLSEEEIVAKLATITNQP